MEAPDQPESPEVGQTTGINAEGDQAAESAGTKRPGAEKARRGFPPTRKLSDEQEREVTRLYTETSTPTPEIGQRFGIAESTVYRVARRHGVPLRDRPPASAGLEHEVPAISAAPEAPQARPEPQTGTPSPQTGGTPAATPRRPASARRATPKAAPGGARSFRVRFQAEATFEAADIRDALRQAHARGITEITTVSRED